MQLSKPLAIAAATLAFCSIAAAADAGAEAKGPVTGTWSGHTSQDLSLTDKEWAVRITVTALNGRLAGIATTARMECPDPAVQDIRILKGWRPGAGPLLSKHGGFSVRVNGVSISGALGPGGGSGRFDIAKGGCSGKGSWKARRVL
jgi:hypothetical protein